jgi:hypothetical protein
MNKQINLSYTIIVTKTYSGKSKFDFWKKLKVGDMINISLKLESTGSNRGISYAPCVTLINYGNGGYASNPEKFTSTVNDIVKYLEKINYE